MKMCFSIAFCLFYFYSTAQDTIPINYFSSPVDFKLLISSNFGKIRSNHFHAGIDINTKLKTGLNIYASADGYISRVNISSTGYGKALYITHPNGFVSVYAHLSQIEKKLANYVHQLQYQKHRFPIDIDLPKGKFLVKKGQVIGKSGNTGQSYGAHLHFEMRDQQTEEIINPFHFGFKIVDTEAPKINSIYLYRFLSENGQNIYIKKQKIKVVQNDTIISYGKLGLGLEIRDFLTSKKGNFDAYQASLKIDDSLYFEYQFDRFSFDESKYINSFIDYNEFKVAGRKIIKFFIEPNNKLSIYKTLHNGLFTFDDLDIHKLSISVSDIAGNITNMDFYIKSDTSALILQSQKTLYSDKNIDCTKVEEFKTDSFAIVFNKDCLFDNLDFNYNASSSWASEYSKFHYVHNSTIPLFKAATIAIKPKNIPENYKSKALIAGIGHNHQLYSVGGIWENGFVKADIGNFGIYFVRIDTVLPTIEQIVPKTKSKKTTMKPLNLNFRITDDLSGIEEYVAFIDDSWVLFEFDKKNNLISCNLSKENIQPGNHNLIIWVRDKCNNLNFYESQFSN